MEPNQQQQQQKKSIKHQSLVRRLWYTVEFTKFRTKGRKLWWFWSTRGRHLFFLKKNKPRKINCLSNYKGKKSEESSLFLLCGFISVVLIFFISKKSCSSFSKYFPLKSSGHVYNYQGKKRYSVAEEAYFFNDFLWSNFDVLEPCFIL